MRRLVAVAAASAGLLLIAGCGGSGGDSTEAATTTAPPVANLRIIFPEGLNVREMGDRVAAVREIAIAKRGVTPRLTRAAVPRGRQARSAAEDLPPRLEARLAGGLPLSGALRVHPVHERQRARLRPAGGVPQELCARQPRVRTLEEPDAV